MGNLQFINAPLLWGLLLASVPIVIHLLFRRRFRRVEWAPMHYLKLSIQRNRRRVRLEQLLLLATRVALVLLLFFLVARPLMQAAGLGGWLGGRSRTSQVLVLDDSLSTDYRQEGRSAFQRAQELAAEVVRTLGPKDRFTLVLASRPDEPLMRDVELASPEDATRLIAAQSPAQTFASWKTALSSIDKLVEGSSYPIIEATLFTDLRRAGWDDDLAELGNRWAAGRVSLRVFDVGSPRDDNVSLDALRPVERLALVGAPLRFEAEVRNDGNRELAGLDATFVVDGSPTAVRLPTIAAGERVKIPLSATFQEAGPHHVSFQLPDDELPADNQRWLVANVREQLNIVLIDGEPSSEPLGGELDFLALALGLGVGEADAFQMQLTTDAEWSGGGLGRPDLIVLGNVASIAPEQADELARLVEGGAGAMIFLGEQVADPTSYNQTLYRGGAGPLPAALDVWSEEEASGLLVEQGEAGPLVTLLQLNPAVLERIKVRRFYQVQSPEVAPQGVRVVARWNNAAASPAVLERSFGRGRLMLWTVTADRAWSDWPTEPSYVMAIREAAKAIARADDTGQDGLAGDAIRHEVAAERTVTDATIEAPSFDAPQPLKLESPATGAAAISTTAAATTTTTDGAASDSTASAVPPNSGSQGIVLAFPETRRAGLYKLSWKESPGGPATALYAVNPDRRETDLARIEPDALKSLWGGLPVEVISGVSGNEAIAVRGVEIWRNLALGLLGLMAFEACFATWAGRQR